MYTSDFQIRVRYADTDQMGYVYYGNYAAFYEVGRVEAMRALGFSYAALEQSGIMMPVLECHSKFLAPARYDELITLRTIIPELPGVRIRFNYELFGESGKCIHTGHTLLAFIDSKAQRPVRPPAEILRLLKPFF